MAVFVQLAIFGFVFDFVVYWQTSTVVYTPQVALCWVWSDRPVKNMADELLVLLGMLLHIKMDLFTFSCKAVSFNLQT